MAKSTKLKDEREVANNCVTILADLLGREMGMETKLRKDKQPYIEFMMRDNETGETNPFMRIDVLCRIFDQ